MSVLRDTTSGAPGRGRKRWIRLRPTRRQVLRRQLRDLHQAPLLPGQDHRQALLLLARDLRHALRPEQELLLALHLLQDLLQALLPWQELLPPLGKVGGCLNRKKESCREPGRSLESKRVSRLRMARG